MGRYYYDLHIHSCLSPCGDADMTPNNIAGMAALKGLQIAALTDHNSAKNCPAFYAACKKQGVVPVAGMELTTAEDIHLVCLFETLEAACAFGAAVEAWRVPFPNRADIFGEQLVLDENDEIIDIEKNFLPNATRLPLEAAATLAEQYGALTYPAHIDRQANGIVATLGTFPDTPAFRCAEFRDAAAEPEYRAEYPALSGVHTVCSSDAHYLWDIHEAEHYFELEDEPYSGDLVRSRLFARLRAGG